MGLYVSILRTACHTTTSVLGCVAGNFFDDLGARDVENALPPVGEA
jgi:hypothetical protein